MTQIIHHSDRNSRLIAEGRLDGSPAWVEQFNGTTRDAQRAILAEYGRPKRRNGLRYQYDGFTLTMQD